MLVHDRSLVQWDDAFGCGWTITQGAVWPDRVVMTAPVFDEYLSLAQRVEELAVEEFIPEACTVTPVCRSFDTISSGLSRLPAIL